MTLKEKLRKTEPSKINDSYMGGVRGCPYGYDELKSQPQLCENQGGSSNERCTKCWNQEFKESEKVMTKSDLKTGMRVETERGTRLIVVKECEIANWEYQDILFVGNSCYLPGSQINEDLTSNTYERDKIVKIYEKKGPFNFLDLNVVGKLIWERKEEPKKMTVSEIVKELGYEIEIVK